MKGTPPRPRLSQRLLDAMSRQCKYQLRHKRTGLCYDCSRPVASGTVFCELHRRKRNLENRERQRERFGTVKLKATNSRGATLMSVKAPIFSDPRCERRVRHCGPVHITLSLLCGEQKRQNPPREALENRTGNLGGAAHVTGSGR